MKDKERLHEWYSQLTQIPHTDTTYKNNPYRREGDLSSLIRELYHLIPTDSTKGNSQYHR